MMGIPIHNHRYHLEIPCLVTVKTPAPLKNIQLAEKYLELVKERYTEPKNEEILGSFVNEIDEEDPLQKTGKRRMRNNTSPPQKRSTQLDIRKMFSNQGCSTNKPLKKKVIPEVIEIDY